MKKFAISSVCMVAVLLFGGIAFSGEIYTKLNDQGIDLGDDATDWKMVRDNKTLLIWEIKQNKDNIQNYSNLHDADNTYTWYNSNPSQPFYAGTGWVGDGNNTEAFINALNTANFGNSSDWRLPTIQELASIVDLSGASVPTIHSYFLNMKTDVGYWTATHFAQAIDTVGYAWAISFLDATDDNNRRKSYPLHVIAVRGGKTMQDPHFVSNSAQSIKDNYTNFIWQKTSGSVLKTLTQATESLSLIQAVQVGGAGDYYGWRLPTREELRSIVNYASDAPAIYSDFFSSQPSYFWTSNPLGATQAWYIDFTNGSAGYSANTESNYVWAVLDKTKIVTPATYKPGDINHDNNVDLKDVIATLQVLAGLMPTVYTDKEINGDTKIGLEEVIYILQVVAQLRPQQ